MARRGFGPPRSAPTPPIRSAVQRTRLLTVSAFCFTTRRASLGRALCSYRARGAGLPGAINVWEGCDSRRLQLARETGALTELPFALDALSAAYTFAGEPAEAASLIDPNWGLGELIVAAFRSGKTERAADALHRLSAMTHASGTDRALGIEARSRARLSDGDTAERLYLGAIGRLGRIRIRVELARAHLLWANGCAASAGGWMPARSCVLPTRCLRGSVPRPSQIAPHLSRWLPRGAPRKRTVQTREDLTPAGGSDRAAGPRGALRTRDGRAGVHQPVHRRIPPAQGLRRPSWIDG